MDTLIYILQDCDEPKSYSSMRIYLVTTDIDRLHQVIRDRIAKGDYPVDGEENVQTALERWDEIITKGVDPYHLQDHLTYAAISIFEDGVL